MSQLVIPNGFANCTWAWSHSGSSNLASTSLAIAGAGPFDDPSDAFDLMESAWGEFRPALPEDTVLQSLRITLGAAAEPYAVFERGVFLPGLSAQEQRAPQLCVLARKRTAFAGRKYRGRMYLPAPLGVDSTSAGVLLGTEWSDAVNTFHATIAESPLVSAVVLLHTEPSSDVPPTPLLPPGNGLVAENYVATQRRRLRRNSAPAA